MSWRIYFKDLPLPFFVDTKLQKSFDICKFLYKKVSIIFNIILTHKGFFITKLLYK